MSRRCSYFQTIEEINTRIRKDLNLIEIETKRTNIGRNSIWMKFISEEEGVSPVIGVILMVAITVTLAAIVAAFVMGNAGNVERPRVVETRAIQVNETHGQVTLIKGAEGMTIQYLNVSLNGQPKASKLNPVIGEVISFGGATRENDHVVVVAKFGDGKEQVVLDGYI